MKSVKAIKCIIIRGYARHSPSQSNFPRDSPRFKEQADKVFNPDLNEYNYDPTEDYDDFGDANSDFPNFAQTYSEHMREVKYHKASLKKQMIRRKYFKSSDPHFITWTEKDQIQSLHENNNVEWTPERLSESFPALPETIRKILRAKWLPKSVEAVIKHDQDVINHWKLFKNGSLTVDPRLHEHLRKFEDRNIEIASLATIAEKFVKKPPVFRIPKSQTFSNLVRSHDNYMRSDGEEGCPHIVNPNEQPTPPRKKLPKSGIPFQHVTFDAFLEKNINHFADDAELSLESRLLVEEYKEKRSSAALNNGDSLNAQYNEKESSTIITTAEPPTMPTTMRKIEPKYISLDTRVLDWKKKEVDGDGDFPNFIKIPRVKYSSGVTFKVQDRYYDIDGEFLYRIPGLKISK